MSSTLDQARAGDIEAFARLFEPLRPVVLAVARRLVGEQDAEDVAMDTFLRAWKALPGYRGVASLKTWTLRIARNACLDRLRRCAASPAVPLPEASDERPTLELSDPTRATPDEIVRSRDAARLLRHALDRLDTDHRVVLLLRFAEDLSYAEIAAATGLPIGTVMSRLFNGKRKLRAIWETLDQRGEGRVS